MLVLTRKVGEKLLIDSDIEISIVDITSGVVKIGIEAPKQVSIYREEIYREIKEQNNQSKFASVTLVNRLIENFKKPSNSIRTNVKISNIDNNG